MASFQQQSQWDAVTWNNAGKKKTGQSKSQQVNAARRSNNSSVGTSKKYGGGANIQGGAIKDTARLDEEEDNKKHAKVSVELKKLIQQSRIKAGVRTQKEFATLCNIQVTLVQKYEAGTAIPSPQLLGKMERAIRRKDPEFELGTFTKANKKGGKKAPKRKA